MADLRVRGLTVSYRRQHVLQGVDFDAPGGTVTGVIGPNGAGKSTMLKAIAGLVTPDRGTITLGGRTVALARRRIAYLAQDSAVSWQYPAQVRDVVGMGRYPHRRWRRLRTADRQLVADALSRVGMETLATTAIADLSGGQRQRVLVARAFAQQATLLLMDEPFANLDVGIVSLLCQVLRDAASAGASIVVVNHDLTVLPELCDHVVMFSRRVLAQGSVEAVLSDQMLAAAYGFGSPPGLADTQGN